MDGLLHPRLLSYKGRTAMSARWFGKLNVEFLDYLDSSFWHSSIFQLYLIHSKGWAGTAARPYHKNVLTIDYRLKAK